MKRNLLIFNSLKNNSFKILVNTTSLNKSFITTIKLRSFITNSSTTTTTKPIFKMATTNSNLFSLGDRMKSYEKEYGYKLQKNQPFIIRLDGHGFSKFTRKFNKPWDIRIHNAMVKAAEALLTSFNPTCVYTFSDEITLCFPSIQEVEGVEVPSPAFGGKIQKLTTLAAGLASTVFYKSITTENYDSEKDKEVIKLLENATPHFDSRLFVLPNNYEIVNNLIWRSVIDCKRNSIYGLGREHYSDKQLFKLSTITIKKKLLEEKGIDYEAEPDWYKYGVYFKKQQFTFNSFNPLDKKEVTSLRHKFSRFSFNITLLKDRLNFVTDKSLKEDFQLEFEELPEKSTNDSEEDLNN